MKLLSWPGRSVGRFIYVDAKGEQHDTWPPRFDLWPQLPNSILLEVQQDAAPQLIAAVPRGSLEAKAPTTEMTERHFEAAAHTEATGLRPDPDAVHTGGNHHRRRLISGCA